MFLHLRVVLWGVGFPACITGHMTRGICIQGGLPRGGGSASASRGSASKGDWEGLPGSASRGVCIQGGWADPPSPEILGILWNMVNRRAVCILLECFLVHF